MNEDICRAIREKRRIRFRYNGKQRFVEPQCCGVGAKGTELLRAYQLTGGAQPEPLFDMSKVVDLVILGETFERPGPHYKRDDSAMVRIFCQL